MYEHATYGLPPIYFDRPKHLYDRARSTDVALERLGEMAGMRMSDEGLVGDLLRLLEDCEDQGSIDLIEKIFAFYQKSPFDPPAYSVDRIIDDPASEKQRAFLKRLGIRNFSGTKSQARKKIDEILAERELTK